MIDKNSMNERFYDSLCGLAAALGMCDPDDADDQAHFDEVMSDFCEKWDLDEESATAQALMLLEDDHNPPGDAETAL